MLAKERQNLIYELIQTEGTITTAELTDKFKISDETVRRDLLVLEKEGKLRRVHGGAVTIAEMKTYLPFKHRAESARSEKAHLAELAIKRIKDGETIGIDSGTTAAEFAEALVRSNLRLTVVTHSLDIFNILTRNKSFRVILCGGHFHRTENAFYGSLTIDTLKTLHVQKAFLCPSAISLSHGICDFDHMLMDVQKQLISSASEVIVLADSGKFETNALLKLCDVKATFTYITDPKLSPGLKKLYSENNIKIISCKEDL